jgi:C4-dicarboxylate transporter, DctQ subunit
MGARFVYGLYFTEQVSPDLEMPRWIVFLCVPLGSFLMCFRFLQVAWTYWRTDELPHHNPGHVEGVLESPQAAKDLAR